MISRLIEEIKKKNAPIVVGLDPMLSYVPKKITDRHIAEKGETLEAAASAILEYNKAIVDAVYDLVPAVKPQIAMYEQYGLDLLEEEQGHCPPGSPRTGAWCAVNAEHTSIENMEFVHWPHYLLVSWPWESYLTSLCFGFSSRKCE